MKHLIYSFLCLSICIGICRAQSTTSISGKVIDGKTNEPLAFASVYFNNSTFGAITDSLGRFQIKNIPLYQSELVASSIGYKSVKLIVQLTAGRSVTANFKLYAESTLLSEVVIQSKKGKERQKWEEKYTVFKDIFLGTTNNAKETEIVNPNVIGFEGEVFEFKKDKSYAKAIPFEAFASKPIEVLNNALGYKVSVSLVKFSATPRSFEMLMYTHFDTLPATDAAERIRWHRNRIEAYYGSPTHLFRSIKSGKYLEEGFRIYEGNEEEAADYQSSIIYANANKVPVAKPENILVDTAKNSFKILRRGFYQINYVKKIIPANERTFVGNMFPVSWLAVSDAFVTLKSSGEALNTNLVVEGYFKRFRIADMLPSDFDPKEEEKKYSFSRKAEMASVRGIVIDDSNKPLVGVEVFVNHGLQHTTTNAWGQFEMGNLYPGKYPIGFALGGKKEILKTIVALPENQETVIVQLSSEKQPPPIESNEDRASYLTLFKRELLSEGFNLSSSGLENPHVLQFKKINEALISIHTTAPLVAYDSRLGYQWKYFIEKAFLKKKIGNNFNLSIEGLVKMDTLTAKNTTQRNNWKENRMEEYEGSWNHFVSSLVDGNQKREGFLPYTFHGTVNEKKPMFKSVVGKQLQLVNPDSIITAENGKIYLRNISGLEIHHQTRKGKNKFYRKYSNTVTRLTSDSTKVAVTRSGIFAPEDLTLAGSSTTFLKTVPVDYQLETHFSDLEPLVFLKTSNLKIVNQLREKTYLQTDKPYYHPTDTIWMKAYMKYAAPQLADTLSKVLYVDLLDSIGTVVENHILKIENGMTHGEFVLPIDLPTGNYFLKAYTNWMRNFNEVFIKPVPIIKLNSFIEPQANTPVLALGKVKVTLTADKQQYKTRSSVGINVNVSSDSIPQLTNFSVSVVDQSAVAQLNNLPTIYSLLDKSKAEKASMIRLKYPLERGITLSGSITPYPSNFVLTNKSASPKKVEGVKKETFQVTAALLNKNEQEIIQTNKKSFSFSFDFNDTTTAILKALDKDDQIMGIELATTEPSISALPSQLKFSISKNSLSRYAPNTAAHVKMLGEVTVKASRINPLATTATVTSRRYGAMTKLLEGPALAEVRKANNLLYLLNRTVPGFRASVMELIGVPPGDIDYEGSVLVSAFEDAANQQGRGGGPPSTSAFATGSPFSRPPYKIFVDGAQINYQYFFSFANANISRIEVFDKLSGADDYIISIYTETSFPINAQNYKFKLRGYTLPLQFTAPSPTNKLPDYRSTIYWNPTVSTDEHGEATFSFTTSDAEGKYLLTIEGITKEGEVFRAVNEIIVNE
jgi:hypothetical protein